MAVVDRREIELDMEAVTLAIEWSPQAALAFGLPPMTPTHARCDPANGYVEVVYGTLTSTKVFALRAEALGALLISYCNRAGMPIARNADKGVRLERGHVVLVVTLRLDIAPRPDASEGAITRAPEAVQAWSWIESGH